MTTAITQSYGALAQVIANSAAVHRRLDELSIQASSGLKSDSYAGLGPSAHISLDLHRQIDALQTWQDNIDAASGRMQVTQTAMTQLQQIAADFGSQLNNLNGLDAQNIDVVASSARDALTQVAELLNTKYGDMYVFAGQDTGNPPVPDENIAGLPLFSDIQSLVAGLSGNADAIFNGAIDVATQGSTTASPFSAYLSSPATNIQRQQVQIGPDRFQPIGLVASANTYASTAPTSDVNTTGSAIRDMMASLAVVGSLSSSEANDSGFYDLVQDARKGLTGAVSGLAVEAGALGNVQSSLTATRTQLGDTSTALSTQVSNAEDADMAETLSNLSQVQTQLQASYQLIAGLSGLSLAKYLPVG